MTNIYLPEHQIESWIDTVLPRNAGGPRRARDTRKSEPFDKKVHPAVKPPVLKYIYLQLLHRAVLPSCLSARGTMKAARCSVPCVRTVSRASLPVQNHAPLHARSNWPRRGPAPGDRQSAAVHTPGRTQTEHRLAIATSYPYLSPLQQQHKPTAAPLDA